MRLEEEVGARLLDLGLTLATAESCTGGLLGHRITNVPGSSAYYLGGFVAYANEMKESSLGVRHETLVAHGTVSEETAREMSQGARRRLGANVALAVTGIAGPGGATEEKPVGLVYVALSASDAELCQRHVWQGDRLANKEQSADAALQLLLSYLEERWHVPATDSQRKTLALGKPVVAFINEPVTVKVREKKDEALVPTAFVWRDRRYEINSWGRESSVVKAGRSLRCYLVQTTSGVTWELCYEAESCQWMLTRHWHGTSQHV